MDAVLDRMGCVRRIYAIGNAAAVAASSGRGKRGGGQAGAGAGVWNLESGRIAKKHTEGRAWRWRRCVIAHQKNPVRRSVFSALYVVDERCQWE